jgi:hypothetical protein
MSDNYEDTAEMMPVVDQDGRCLYRHTNRLGEWFSTIDGLPTAILPVTYTEYPGGFPNV